MKHDPNVVFEGSIPENYDRYLGPAFFEPFAVDMAARLKRAQPMDVLELACGTGIVTRRLPAAEIAPLPQPRNFAELGWCARRLRCNGGAASFETALCASSG